MTDKPWNIDDTAAEHLRNGEISQEDDETPYSPTIEGDVYWSGDKEGV